MASPAVPSGETRRSGPGALKSVFEFPSSRFNIGKSRLFLHVEEKQREIAADSAGRFVWQENGPNLFVMRVIKGRVFRLDPESLKDYSSRTPPFASAKNSEAPATANDTGFSAR